MTDMAEIQHSIGSPKMLHKELLSTNLKANDSFTDEKHLETTTVSSVNLKDHDAALDLVGIQRTSQFSEEYNLKLRRKLVSYSDNHYKSEKQKIETSHALLGSHYPPFVYCGIFHSILVRSALLPCSWQVCI